MKRKVYAIYENGTSANVKTIEVTTVYEAAVWIKNNDKTLMENTYGNVIGFNLTGHVSDALKKRIKKVENG